MASGIEFNTDIDVKGKVYLTNTPNQKGTVVTHGVDGALSTRSNVEILSDLDLISATNIASHYFADGDLVQTKNTFGGRKLFNAALDNYFAAADKVFVTKFTVHKKVLNGVTYPRPINQDNPLLPQWEDSPVVVEYDSSMLFEGTYETGLPVASDSYAIVSVDVTQNKEEYWQGYPYGSYLLNYYYTDVPERSEVRFYNGFEPSGLGYKTIPFIPYKNTNRNVNYVEIATASSDYFRRELQFVIYGHPNHNTTVTELEYYLDRPSFNSPSTFSNYGPNKAYYPMYFGFRNNNTIEINPNGNIKALNFLGNATSSSTADKLRTPRNINNVLFDGSRDINISQLLAEPQGYDGIDTKALINQNSFKYDTRIIPSSFGMFSANSNANAILSISTHPGTYGYQVGFSSDSNIYVRDKQGGDFPDTWRHLWDSRNLTKVSQLLNDSAYATEAWTNTYFDKYGWWRLNVNGTLKELMRSDSTLDLTAGPNISLLHSAGGVVKIDTNLQIGGRNYFKNSLPKNSTEGYGGYYSELTIFENSIRVVGNSDYVGVYTHYVKPISAKTNKTISLLVKNNNATQITLGIFPDGNGVLNIGEVPANSGWVKLKKTFLPSDYQIDKEFTTLLYIFSYGASDFQIKELKIEEGNEATDWTPAPEDQVSDWNSNDPIDFGYIKNKPQYGTVAGTIAEGNHTHNNYFRFERERLDLDLDTLRESGVYSGGQTSNMPSGANRYSPFTVMQSSSDRFVQMWYDSYDTDNIYYRGGTINSWQPWVKLLHSGHFGTSAGTVAEGNHTHTKLISTRYGALNANSLIEPRTLEYNSPIYSTTTGSSNVFPHINDANSILSLGSWGDDNYGHQLGFSSDNNIYHRTKNPGSYTSWSKIWNSTNLSKLSQLNDDLGYSRVLYSEYVHSARNFPDGTFILTDIDYTDEVSSYPFLMEMKGNMYSNLRPLDFKLQGYIYGAANIISATAYSNQDDFNVVDCFSLDGKLCFWFLNMSYWQGFSVKVTNSSGGVNSSINHVVAIDNRPHPGGTKNVSVYVEKVVHRTWLSQNYVTLDTEQSITGLKYFNNGLRLNSYSVRTYDSQNILVAGKNVLGNDTNKSQITDSAIAIGNNIFPVMSLAPYNPTTEPWNNKGYVALGSAIFENYLGNTNYRPAHNAHDSWIGIGRRLGAGFIDGTNALFIGTANMNLNDVKYLDSVTVIGKGNTNGRSNRLLDPNRIVNSVNGTSVRNIMSDVIILGHENWIEDISQSVIVGSNLRPYSYVFNSLVLGSNHYNYNDDNTTEQANMYLDSDVIIGMGVGKKFSRHKNSHNLLIGMDYTYVTGSAPNPNYRPLIEGSFKDDVYFQVNGRLIATHDKIKSHEPNYAVVPLQPVLPNGVTYDPVTNLFTFSGTAATTNFKVCDFVKNLTLAYYLKIEGPVIEAGTWGYSILDNVDSGNGLGWVHERGFIATYNTSLYISTVGNFKGQIKVTISSVSMLGDVGASLGELTNVSKPVLEFKDGNGVTTLEARSGSAETMHLMFGKNSGRFLNYGTGMILLGNNVYESSLYGTNSTIIGNNTARNNMFSVQEILIGDNILRDATLGSRGNVIIGHDSIVSPSERVARNNVLGNYIFRNLKAGNYNVGGGEGAGELLNRGLGNVFLGYNSGRFYEGDHNVFLGGFAGSHTIENKTFNNVIVLGAQVTPEGNTYNTVTIGNTSITDNYFRGIIHANSFKVRGGLSNQVMMADGSVKEQSTIGGSNYTAGSNISIAGNAISVVNSPTFSGSVTAPAFYEGSLKSLKKNIKTFEKSGLDLVGDLNIVTFDRKDESAKNKIGIIADDSPKEFLSEELDAVDLYKTVFIQAKAIQELSEENKILREELNNLRELIMTKLNQI